jgi:carbon-monoxide dehydrogenase small subunit
VSDTVEVTLRVNGQTYSDGCEPRRTLADFLRRNCGLTGTHLGCEHGVCGACTVRLGGRTVRACLVLAVEAQNEDVATVEGLADGGRLSVLQDAFWERHGLQCGFCTSGILMAAQELLEENPDPDEAAIRERLSGNLCRCTGYEFIVDSVKVAAARLRDGEGR